MTALLHLVSEQTMQNLLPILALRPKTVVQVRSRPDKFHQAADNLKNAVLAMSKTPLYRDLNPEFFDWPIDEDSPSVERSKSKVGEALSLWPGAIVNLTGGTKQMSIGAYLAADYQREPMLYCDTAQRQFIPVGKRPLSKLPPFEQIAASLTVEAVMAAHGTPPAKWKSKEASKPLLGLGRCAWELHNKDRDALLEYGKLILKHFRGDKANVPSAPSELQTLAAKPLPTPSSESVMGFLDAATQAGLLLKDGRNNFFPAAEWRDRNVQELANILNGSWMELFVLSHLAQEPDKWSDLHWSVAPQERGKGSLGETDVVCLDAKSAALQIISCKTKLQKRLEVLEALTERRARMGGTYAKAALAVLHVQPNEREELRKLGELLQVQVLIGDEITRAFTA